MRLLANYRRPITFSLGALIFCIGVYALRAEDEPKQDGTDSAYQVPETKDPAELIQFIEKVRDERPPRPRGGGGRSCRTPGRRTRRTPVAARCRAAGPSRSFRWPAGRQR